MLSRGNYVNADFILKACRTVAPRLWLLFITPSFGRIGFSVLYGVLQG
jgi:hypothetical protein